MTGLTYNIKGLYEKEAYEILEDINSICLIPNNYTRDCFLINYFNNFFNIEDLKKNILPKDYNDILLEVNKMFCIYGPFGDNKNETIDINYKESLEIFLSRVVFMNLDSNNIHVLSSNIYEYFITKYTNIISDA